MTGTNSGEWQLCARSCQSQFNDDDVCFNVPVADLFDLKDRRAVEG
jgi:hypothetical protein